MENIMSDVKFEQDNMGDNEKVDPVVEEIDEVDDIEDDDDFDEDEEYNGILISVPDEVKQAPKRVQRVFQKCVDEAIVNPDSKIDHSLNIHRIMVMSVFVLIGLILLGSAIYFFNKIDALNYASMYKVMSYDDFEILYRQREGYQNIESILFFNLIVVIFAGGFTYCFMRMKDDDWVDLAHDETTIGCDTLQNEKFHEFFKNASLTECKQIQQFFNESDRISEALENVLLTKEERVVLQEQDKVLTTKMESILDTSLWNQKLKVREEFIKDNSGFVVGELLTNDSIDHSNLVDVNDDDSLKESD